MPSRLSIRNFGTLCNAGNGKANLIGEAIAALLAIFREKPASFKIPTAIEFKSSLPRTSSGKTQKFLLREKEWAGHEKRIQGV